MKFDSTIAAISTPPGEGGISVIRVSGEKTFDIIGNIFSKIKNRKQKINLSELNSHTVHFGYIFDNVHLIDEVLLSIFKKPNSYTGENTAEISMHGNYFIAEKVLNLLINTGARLAEPGEFTKRAFLNGKMDLSQAEAVADLIKSKTDISHQYSISQLEGSISDYINRVRNDIISTIALLELELDFSEEDLEFVSKTELKQKIQEISSQIEDIISTYTTGKIIRDGLDIVISGKPNSGKSSLFNYLLKSDRAIVSHISGTTRDYITESIILEGVLINLIDTAGIRTSADIIEEEGIKRTHKMLDEADIIIYLIDGTLDKSDIEKEYLYFTKNLNPDKTILTYSKRDLFKEKPENERLEISIYDDDSIKKLKKEIIKTAKRLTGYNKQKSAINKGNIILTNFRHKLCFEKTLESLNNALDSINSKMSSEFISLDLRNALNALGEITGEVTNDEILNYIFKNFCIGK